MEISALASGSSGNCFYIENNGKAVLIDAGISTKQIIKRLSAIKKNPKNVKGIFITHEHSDHIKGAGIFARKFNIPIFATKKTFQNSFICSDEKLINFIKNNETIKIGGMVIEAFSKSHMGADPVSYSISNNKKISVITDIGYCCKNVISNITDSDFLCLEANHDETMLESGPYPYFLKNRVKSKLGHLSNLKSALCVLEYAPKELGNIILSHLSKINNHPEIALKTFSHLLKERIDLSPKTSVSLMEKPTPLFKI